MPWANLSAEVTDLFDQVSQADMAIEVAMSRREAQRNFRARLDWNPRATVRLDPAAARRRARARDIATATAGVLAARARMPPIAWPPPPPPPFTPRRLVHRSPARNP